MNTGPDMFVLNPPLMSAHPHPSTTKCVLKATPFLGLSDLLPEINIVGLPASSAKQAVFDVPSVIADNLTPFGPLPNAPRTSLAFMLASPFETKAAFLTALIDP